MKHKTSKMKKVTLIALASVCALSTAAAISAGAASEKYVHTVSVTTDVGSNAATWINMKKSAAVTDEFAGYPTIYSNYSSSTNKSRAEHGSTGVKTSYKSFTLYKDRSAPISVSYGTLNYTGDWRLYYTHTSGGGFRDPVTTIKWY